MPIVFQDGKLHSTNGKSSQPIHLKLGTELSIRNYVGNLIHNLLPVLTNKNTKKFAQAVGLFTENFSDYEKYIVYSEIKSILKAWDELKPPKWKKFVKTIIKSLPGLTLSFI